MKAYIEPIQTALLFFPLVAFLFTLPYMFQQYNCHGSILVLRTLIVYSFILYLICAYFLTILPLPEIEKVRTLTSPTIQLVPFREAVELFHKYSIVWNSLSSVKAFILNRDFFQIAANIGMTIPFGIYLGYYFGASLKKTILLSFCLSLLFEVTQYTGLFFIYPRPYRLADVDDLITNTLGGYIGYLISPLFRKILPSKERMDQIAFKRSHRVSVLRRLFAAGVDCMLLLVVATILLGVLPTPLSGDNSMFDQIAFLFGFYTAMVLLYFGVIEWLCQGRTVGKLLVRIRLGDVRTSGRPKLWQCIVRYGIFYLIVIPAPVMVLVILSLQGGKSSGNSVLAMIVCLFLMLVFIVFCVATIIMSFSKGNQLPHGWLSKTENFSTLKKGKAVASVPKVEA
ncbi:MAG: VanZ family protein [Eubacteriales bacterium]|nr:VanZ family protein [Eubacteriales bacterium]